MLTKKIALTAGALTLAAGGVAAAAGSPPEAAERGLSVAEAHAGKDLPARPVEVADDLDQLDEVEDPVLDEAEGTEETDDLDEDAEEAPVEEGVEDDEASGPPEGTHGAKVSAVARSDEHQGRQHGAAVSAAARDNHGAEVRAEARADIGTEERGLPGPARARGEGAAKAAGRGGR